MEQPSECRKMIGKRIGQKGDRMMLLERFAAIDCMMEFLLLFLLLLLLLLCGADVARC